MTVIYPFPGIVGQDHAKKALLCALISPDIRTVLIMGDPGTAKSTLVRSLETIDDKRTILTIPQGITFDRLVGMIDLESAISDGSVRIAPGILEQGNGRILYADDINLMDGTVVATFLSACESGKYVLEREGLSQMIESRFLFLATMDPAEGDLTPGQMDRFDLCVLLDSCDDENMRAEIIRNQFLFEQNPAGFIARFTPDLQSHKKTIEKARERQLYVSIPEGHEDLISSLCDELNVAGHRGDIAVSRAAKALAALDGRDCVNFEDIRLAALLALQHRRGETPSSPPSAPQNGRNAENPDTQNPSDDQQTPDQDHTPEKRTDITEERDEQTRSDLSSPHSPSDQVCDTGSAYDVIRYLDEKMVSSTRKQKSGRRTRVISIDTTGHYHSFRLPGKNRHDIAIDATLRAAAPHQRRRTRQGVAISVKKEDIREKVREKKIAHTILFLVDASGSMGVRRRMVAVKGAILSLLNDAYQKRDRVGLMTFRGKEARLLLPPTRSTDMAVRMLHTIPTGGMTPLGVGIIDACQLLTRGMFAGADENKTIVLLTDGRVNVCRTAGSPYEELEEIARKMAETSIRFIVVDTELGFPRLGRARSLASDLGASYFQLEELGSRGLAGSVQHVLYTYG